jgi:hypothetical protein
VKVKYGSMWVGWCFNEIFGSYGVGVWKHIRRGCGMFFRFVRFEVGDRDKVRFWHDVWCGNQTLKATFLVLFNITHSKETLMADILQFSNDTL